jgi:hypothetical protein
MKRVVLASLMAGLAVVGFNDTKAQPATPEVQVPALIGSSGVAPAEIAGLPAVRAIRETFPACRSFDAAHVIRVKVDRGPDATQRDDVFALVSGDCRRGRTQFLYLGIDRGADEPEPVLVQLFAQVAFDGLAYDTATRRLFGRVVRRDRLEELPWQRFAREYLLRQQAPITDYVGLMLPPTPAGPVPPVTAIAAPPPPPDPAVALRERLESELRPQIEAQLRERLRTEVRQELFAEVQARLDRAREMVMGLESQLAAERQARERLTAELATRDAALRRAEARREEAERYLGFARAIETERAAREAAMALANAARAAAESARAEVQRLEEELRRREIETETRTAPPATNQ